MERRLGVNCEKGIDDEIVVAVAQRSDESELTALLREGFSKNRDVTVIDSAFFVDHFYGRSAVVVARSGALLLGTMRATLVSNPREMGHFDDEGHFLNELRPALYLSRAATKLDSLSKGINSIMRLYCTEAAINLGLRGVVGFVYQGASRTKLMSRMGYSFFPLRAEGNLQLKYESPCLFARLPLEKLGKSAIATLRSEVANSGKNVRWAGPTIAETLLEV
jgi:hypothetical protein